MIKKTKPSLQVALTLACALVAGLTIASEKSVQLDNGTSVSATDVALADGNWVTFKMIDGTRAVAMLDPAAQVSAPAIDGWDDAVLLLRTGGIVQFRGTVTANGNALVFKRRDGLALTLPASQVARVTGVRAVAPKRVAEPTATTSRPDNDFIVAITNEDLPEVDDPSPELPLEPVGEVGEVGEVEPGKPGQDVQASDEESAEPRADDEDWWRSEMSRLNSKLEAAQMKIYAVFSERKALESDIETNGGVVKSEHKKLRQELNRRMRRAETEREGVRSQKAELERAADKADVPTKWLRGS